MKQRLVGRLTGSILAGVFLAGVPGWAAEGDGESRAELPGMVISANRYETPAAAVGSAVTVITAAEIEARKQSTVLEVLRTVPGVEVTQSGGPGRLADVAIRGASSSQTLVLVDGVRVNAASLGAFDFSGLSAENIERIEVLRGPQSTLYGSEALGGVISITTRRGTPGVAGSARVEGGTPEQWLGTAEVRGGQDGVDYSVGASAQRYAGLSAVDKSAGGREKDTFENVSTSGRVGFDVLDDGRADLTFRYFHSDVDVDGFDGMAVADDLNATTTRDGVAAGATVRMPLSDWWQQTFTAGIYDERLEGDDPDTADNRYRLDNRNVDVSAQADLTVIDRHILSAGYEFENRYGESRGSYDEDADINSVYAQDQWNPLEALYLTAGARLDDHSEYGSEDTYRGTVAYDIPETVLRAHASVGTGFKAPTLTDLFFPFYGNPDLEAETSLGYDAGLEATLAGGRAVVDVTYFRNEIDNLISFDSSTFLAGNIKDAMAEGVEVAGSVQVLTNAQLSATYTYTDSEDESTGDPLPRRPSHRATLTASCQPLPRISTAVTVVAVNDRIDSDGSDMDDYERVDAIVEYAWNTRVFPYVRVENLLDQDYEEVNSFSSPGFSAIGGVRAVW